MRHSGADVVNTYRTRQQDQLNAVRHILKINVYRTLSIFQNNLSQP